MKAVLCKSYGPPENLVLEEIDSPRPGKGQVLINVFVNRQAVGKIVLRIRDE